MKDEIAFIKIIKESNISKSKLHLVSKFAVNFTSSKFCPAPVLYEMYTNIRTVCQWGTTTAVFGRPFYSIVNPE